MLQPKHAHANVNRYQKRPREHDRQAVKDDFTGRFYVSGYVAGIDKAQTVRLWADPNKNEEIFPSISTGSGITHRVISTGRDYLISEIPDTVYVEGIAAGTNRISLTVKNSQARINPAFATYSALGHENTTTSSQASHRRPNGNVSVSDSLLVTAVSLDLDIDSNNNDGLALPERNAWEEELEDHDYGLGKLVLQSSDLLGTTTPDLSDRFTPFIFHIPPTVDSDTDDLFIKFDFEDSAATAGIFHVWTVDKNNPNRIDADLSAGGHRVFSGTEYKLSDFQRNFAGEVVLYIDGKSRASQVTLNDVETFGRTNAVIEATLIAKQGGESTEVTSDSIKFIVVHDPQFYNAFQFQVHVGAPRGESIRGELAARAVYGENDIPSDERNFSLRRLSNEELAKLGVDATTIDNLFNETSNAPIAGFKAALYQDYAAEEDGTYILAFAGTDPAVDDIIEDVAQGLGAWAPQYQTAMRISHELYANPNIDQNKITAVGHSLGGGLASAASVATGMRARTYNAAGLNERTLYARHANGDLVTENGQFVELYAGSLNRYANPNTLVTAYYVDWDALSLFQDRVPGVVSALGTRVKLDGPYDLALAGTTAAGFVGSVLSLGYAGAVAATANAAIMGQAHLGTALLHGLLVDEVAEIDLLGYCLGSDWCEDGA